MGVGDAWGSDLDWKEWLHPRGWHGRFIAKGGTSSKASAILGALKRARDSFRPRTFRDDAQAAQYLKNISNKRMFGGGGHASVARFRSDYSHVQEDLRDGKIDNPETARYIRMMDASMTTLPDDIIVSQTVRPEAFGLTAQTMNDPEHGIHAQLGNLVGDLGYSSTTMGTPRKSEVAPGSITVVQMIPKGTRAVIPGTVNGGGERQVILDRGHKFRITKVQPDGQGGFYALAIPDTGNEVEGPGIQLGGHVGERATNAERVAKRQGLQTALADRMKAVGDTQRAQDEAQRTQQAAVAAGEHPQSGQPSPVGPVDTGPKGPPPRQEAVHTESSGRSTPRAAPATPPQEQAPAPQAPTPAPEGAPPAPQGPAPSAAPTPAPPTAVSTPAAEAPPAPSTPAAGGPEGPIDFKDAVDDIPVPGPGPGRRAYNEAYLGITRGKKRPEEARRELESDIDGLKERVKAGHADVTSQDVDKLQQLADRITSHFGLKPREKPAVPGEAPAPKEKKPPFKIEPEHAADYKSLTTAEKLHYRTFRSHGVSHQDSMTHAKAVEKDRQAELNKTGVPVKAAKRGEKTLPNFEDFRRGATSREEAEKSLERHTAVDLRELAKEGGVPDIKSKDTKPVLKKKIIDHAMGTRPGVNAREGAKVEEPNPPETNAPEAPRVTRVSPEERAAAAARNKAKGGLHTSPAAEAENQARGTAAAARRTPQGKSRAADLKPGDRIMVERDSEGQVVPEMVRGDKAAFPAEVKGVNPDGSVKLRTDDGKDITTTPEPKSGHTFRHETAAEGQRTLRERAIADLKEQGFDNPKPEMVREHMKTMRESEIRSDIRARSGGGRVTRVSPEERAAAAARNAAKGPLHSSPAAEAENQARGEAAAARRAVSREDAEAKLRDATSIHEVRRTLDDVRGEDLRTMATDRGIDTKGRTFAELRSRIANRVLAVNNPSREGAAPEATKLAGNPEHLARIQAVADAKPFSDLTGDMIHRIDSGMSPAALQHALDNHQKTHNFEPGLIDSLKGLADNPPAMRAMLEDIEREHGLQRLHNPGDIHPINGREQDIVRGGGGGNAEISQPGHAIEHNGERIVVNKSRGFETGEKPRKAETGLHPSVTTPAGQETTKLRGPREETPVNPDSVRSEEFVKAWRDQGGAIRAPEGSPENASLEEIRDGIADGNLTPAEGLRRVESEIGFTQDGIAETRREARDLQARIDAGDFKQGEGLAEAQRIHDENKRLRASLKAQQHASSFLRQHFGPQDQPSEAELKQEMTPESAKALEKAGPEIIRQAARDAGLGELEGNTKQELIRDAVKKAVNAPTPKGMSLAQSRRSTATAGIEDFPEAHAKWLEKELAGRRTTKTLASELRRRNAAPGGPAFRAAAIRSGDPTGRDAELSKLDRQSAAIEQVAHRLESTTRARMDAEARKAKPELKPAEAKRAEAIAQETGLPAARVHEAMVEKKAAEAPPSLHSKGVADALGAAGSDKERQELLKNNLKAKLLDIAKAHEPPIEVNNRMTKAEIKQAILDRHSGVQGVRKLARGGFTDTNLITGEPRTPASGIREDVPLQGDPQGDNMRMHGDSVTMGLAQDYAKAGRNGSANRMMEIRRRATTKNPADGDTPQQTVDALKAMRAAEQDPKFQQKLDSAIAAVDAPQRHVSIPDDTPPLARRFLEQLETIPHARKTDRERSGAGHVSGPSLAEQVAQVYRDAAQGKRDEAGHTPEERLRDIVRMKTHESNESAFRLWDMEGETKFGGPLQKELRAWETAARDKAKAPSAPAPVKKAAKKVAATGDAGNRATGTLATVEKGGKAKNYGGHEVTLEPGDSFNVYKSLHGDGYSVGITRANGRQDKFSEKQHTRAEAQKLAEQLARDVDAGKVPDHTNEKNKPGYVTPRKEVKKDIADAEKTGAAFRATATAEQLRLLEEQQKGRKDDPETMAAKRLGNMTIPELQAWARQHGFNPDDYKGRDGLEEAIWETLVKEIRNGRG